MLIVRYALQATPLFIPAHCGTARNWLDVSAFDVTEETGGQYYCITTASNVGNTENATVCSESTL